MAEQDQNLIVFFVSWFDCDKGDAAYLLPLEQKVMITGSCEFVHSMRRSRVPRCPRNGQGGYSTSFFEIGFWIGFVKVWLRRAPVLRPAWAPGFDFWLTFG
jgi:hypothetical protein